MEITSLHTQLEGGLGTYQTGCFQRPVPEYFGPARFFYCEGRVAQQRSSGGSRAHIKKHNIFAAIGEISLNTVL